MAHGLPIEGTAAGRTTALTLMHEEVATCALDEPPDEITRRIDASPYGFALALSDDRVVIGRVRRSNLSDGAVSVESVLEPGPATIRPHRTVDELVARFARIEARRLIVTDPEGRLLGVVRRDDVPGA